MKVGIAEKWWAPLAIVAASTIMLVQVYLLGPWIVDDAGISFAYALNLRRHGVLTAQWPYPPVEGFSNLLWVLLLSPFSELGPPPVVVKVLAAILMILTYMRLSFAFKRERQNYLAANIALLLLACQPAVNIWAFSGLENSLYLLAGVELLIRAYRGASSVGSRKDALIAGIVASCLLLTRPDGIVFLSAFPIVVLSSGKKLANKDLLLSIGIPILAFITYEVFRLTYFETLLPNTYFAKGGPSLRSCIGIATLNSHTLTKLLTFAESIFPWPFQTWGLLTFVTLIVYLWTRGSKADGLFAATVVFSGLSVLVYLLLPDDWMPEFRFATLAYPALYLLLVRALYQAYPRAAAGSLVILLALTALHSLQRVREFADEPTISVKEVEDRSDTYLRWSKMLHVENPSILTADAGGFLIRDDVQFVDLGMLTDRRIAIALGEGSLQRNIQSFYQYIFEERRPTFIATRAYHGWIAHLDDDPRFRAEYVPIREYVDGWILRRYGKQVMCGDYVRRDVMEQNGKVLEEIREEALSLPYPFSEGNL